MLNKNNYKLKSLYKPDVVLTQIGSGELNLNNCFLEFERSVSPETRASKK